jgi:spore coat polysaccharide biosynthesis protein SpsF
LSPRAVAIIQARTGSTRLPRKVFEDLCGEPMLARVVARVSAAERIDAVVVATTTAPGDDAIASMANARGWLLTRGSEDDVLDRYRQAAQEHDAEVILRVCSDCPMTAPDVIDRVVAAVADDAQCDYAANNFEPATYPKGLDVEAFTRAALEDASRSDDRPDWREHVTPYIRRHPERFKHTVIRDTEDHSDLRWTVDTPADLALMRRLITAAPADAHWRAFVAVQRAHPEWAEMNQHIEQRRVPS